MPNIHPSNLTVPGQLHPLVAPPNGRLVACRELRATCVPATMQSTERECVSGVWRVVYIALAGFFFLLGMIGILLPGLPTTPFLLLTSYYLARSWPRMQRLLLDNRLFGSILRHWQQHRAVEPRVKIQATLLVVLAMMFLLFFSSLPVTQLVAVLALASIGLLTIYKLPTIRSLEPEKR